jgi:GxxExxY protein
MDENRLTNEVIGLAIEVHKALGPGLLESAYKPALFIPEHSERCECAMGVGLQSGNRTK